MATAEALWKQHFSATNYADSFGFLRIIFLQTNSRKSSPPVKVTTSSQAGICFKWELYIGGPVENKWLVRWITISEVIFFIHYTIFLHIYLLFLHVFYWKLLQIFIMDLECMIPYCRVDTETLILYFYYIGFWTAVSIISVHYFIADMML